jgi:antibiotic biosynthesis monooxygenase (ABM) superfamily enzyme
MNSSNGHIVSSPRRLAMAPPTPSSRRMPLRPHVGFFVLHFANEEALGAWEASEERDRLVQEARKFSTPDVQRATGLETWFVLPSERAIVPPPRWKMLLVTLIGAYPLVVLLSAFVLPSLEGWPLLVRAAVLPVVLLSLMTYLIMPQLKRLLSGWLYPHQRRPARR